jgi:RNA polymerase sigma-B factor
MTARTASRHPRSAPDRRTTGPTRRDRRAERRPAAPDTDAAFRRLTTLPDGPRRTELCREIAEAWMPMAERLALRYRNRGESLEDLRQVAAIGLMLAVQRYDPVRGSAFESFAIPTIMGEIKRHFRDHLWGVHVPRRVQELRQSVRAAQYDLAGRDDGGGDTVDDIAERTGLSVDDVLVGMEAIEAYAPLSLDAAPPDGDEDGSPLLGTLGTNEPGFDRVVDREAVRPALSGLPERERLILYLRFFCDMSQSRIADRLGISQMHVSRLISRTCESVRREALPDA